MADLRLTIALSCGIVASWTVAAVGPGHARFEAKRFDDPSPSVRLGALLRARGVVAYSMSTAIAVTGLAIAVLVGWRVLGDAVLALGCLGQLASLIAVYTGAPSWFMPARIRSIRPEQDLATLEVRSVLRLRMRLRTWLVAQGLLTVVLFGTAIFLPSVAVVLAILAAGFQAWIVFVDTRSPS